MEVKSFVRHILRRRRLVGFRCEQRALSSHAGAEARSTQHVKQKISSHAFASRPTCRCSLGTFRECFQFVSERATERVVSPTSFLDFLQSAENMHSIDVDSSVTCLVHEDRPIADSCLGRYSSRFGSCDDDRQTLEKWHQPCDKILSSQFQKL